MRHEKAFRKFGRTPAHRRAMFRNLATNLVLHDRIETTLPKAKELKRVADKLVTLGKKNTLHSKRQAMGYLFANNLTSKKKEHSKTKLTAVHKLFEEIAPRYADRHGGYTRVLRTRVREGDKAQLAIIEFVEAELKEKEPARKKRKVRRVKKSDSEQPKKEAKKEAEVTEEEAPKEASAEAAAEDKPAKEAPVEEKSDEQPAEESEKKDSE